MVGNREDAEKIKQDFDSVSPVMFAMTMMRSLAERGLDIPRPEGDPDLIEERAGDYLKAAPQIDEVATDVRKIGDSKLPEVWVGEASERARDVITSAARGIDHTVDVYKQAAKELDVLADALRAARGVHDQGHSGMQQVINDLDGVDNPNDYDALERIKGKGQTAAQQLLDAATKAENAGREAASRFNDLAAQARASSLDSSQLTSADKLVLTQANAPGGPADLNLILSQNDAERSGEFLDRLNGEDRERFDKLLDNAKSPQEKAYLMKALAAGHNMDDIEKFDRLIHEKGDDPQWLRDRLTPVINADRNPSSGAWDSVTYQGQEWTQGDRPTCVAYSTMAARAMTDPVYALQLTTGGHPDDPKFDNGASFNDRAREEAERIYDSGRDGGGLFGWKPFRDDGMISDEGIEVANDDISPATGAKYEHKELDNAGDRRAVLGDVEKAVDEGKPVPVQVQGKDEDEGHQMMIIGHEGDRLQIYNPWGHTVWVSEDDFINGRMGSASTDDLPDPDGVHLPKD